ncbi:MAG TPA: phosphotransferase [Alphaproteobacteria bacterium]|nr:phosphotransferase [Alphaproteobacteria bacterium]
MNVSAGLPDGLLDWVALVTKRKVTGAHRHTARREAWVIETEGSSRYFLRIDRLFASGRKSTRNLGRETALIHALWSRGIPTQRILGWEPNHCAALQSWVSGEAELNHADPALRDKVMDHLMEVLAKLHAIDAADFDLQELVRPRTPLDHSLLELEAIEEPGLFPVSACLRDPLAAFGKRWLINHAPPSVERTVLLQGDTGPANFLFDENGVTALVDWEWGHYGDPMEDLGNICVRDFFYPSADGDLSPYFRRYAELTGFMLDPAKIEYYKIHQLIRSVISLNYLTEFLDWQTPIGLNLGYRAVVDIETCRAMLAASGLGDLAETETLSADEASLQSIIAKQIERFVAPHVSDAFGARLAGGHALIAQHLDLRERHGARFAAEELARLRDLLGSSVTDLARGRKALIDYIQTLSIADEPPVLAHLAEGARAQAALMAPLMTPWAGHRWAKIV